jgi:hypothetical protein
MGRAAKIIFGLLGTKRPFLYISLSLSLISSDYATSRICICWYMYGSGGGKVEQFLKYFRGLATLDIYFLSLSVLLHLKFEIFSLR